MTNYSVTSAALEYEQYFARMNNWSDPRDSLREVIAAQEKRLESYSRRPDAKSEITARNRAELEKLISAYWNLLPMDLPMYKLLNDFIQEAKQRHPNIGVAMCYLPLRLWGEGESVFIDLASRNIV